MRTLVLSTAVLTALALAASSLAVMPRARASFTGVNLSEKPVNGFRPTVRFTVTANGKTLRNFEFQTLGCFGVGNFAVGVDPYAEMPWKVASIPVGKLGTFTATKVKPKTAFPDGIKMTATITGKFAKTDQTTGTISYSMSQYGATCGPKKLKFNAKVGG
jgi:hypothetical protein